MLLFLSLYSFLTLSFGSLGQRPTNLDLPLRVAENGNHVFDGHFIVQLCALACGFGAKQDNYALHVFQTKIYSLLLSQIYELQN